MQESARECARKIESESMKRRERGRHVRERAKVFARAIQMG